MLKLFFIILKWMESFDLKMKNFVTLNFGIKRFIYIKIYQIEKK